MMLTFPTVKPSESISYFTLINSLINLCNTISTYKTTKVTFTFNKKNVKNTLRYIELLEVFLDEIKHRDFKGKSVILPLCDLHVALQEVVYILEELTRLGARVWMLVRARLVAGRFRAVFGSVVDALEGLPEEVICECNEEVIDCFGFLTRQVNRVGFRVEMDDFRALKVVRVATGQVETRVIPDPSELRWALGYLSIKSWAECDAQIRFLIKENESVESGSNLTISLLGLMIYCRCVLFDHIDNNNNSNANHTKNINTKKYFFDKTFNLDDIKCPISLEIMVDPVTISTGHTYDRNSILKWFKSGSSNCPKTGQKLQCLDLVPNVAIKNLIYQYCLQNGVNLPTNSVEMVKTSGNYVGNLAYEGSIKMVCDFMLRKLELGTILEKNKVVYEIRLLSKRSVFNRGCFVECGVIPYLLNLVLVKDSITQENSMAALLNLSKHPEGKTVIVNNGGVDGVIRVLMNGIKIEARQHSAEILFYLSSAKEYRVLIGENPDAIPSLVELIRVGGDHGKINALVAIHALFRGTDLGIYSNHHNLLECKLVPLLITLLGSFENEDLIIRSLAVLSSLAEKREGAHTIVRARALDMIVKVLTLSSSDSSRFIGEHCVTMLLALCIHCGREVLDVLVNNTSLMGALYSLIIDGTSTARKKANSLISILHEFSERSSSLSMGPPYDLPHENFIHVW